MPLTCTHDSELRGPRDRATLRPYARAAPPIAEHGLETEEPERQFGGSHMPGAELDAVQSAALDTPHRFPFCAQNGGTHAR
jgi:hypothetical protein